MRPNAADGAVVADEQRAARRGGRRARAAPSGPARKSAVASASAHQASAASTVTPARPVHAGAPVAGSMRWWRRSSSAPQVRRVRQLETSASSWRRIVPRSRPPSGMLDASRDHGIGAGRGPATRRSPPTFTHAPVGAGAHHEVDDEVGGQPLADAAAVELHAGGQGRPRGRRPRCRRSPGAATGGRRRASAASVERRGSHGRSRRRRGGQHGGVERAVGAVPRLDRALDEEHGLGRHGDAVRRRRGSAR